MSWSWNRRKAGWLPAVVALTGLQAEPEKGFVAKEIQIDETVYRYQVYVPEGWSPAREWPVIVFLHGAGERGSDGQRHVERGLGPAIRQNPGAFPAVIVMPQCRRGVWWNDSAMEQLVLEALDWTLEEYRGDPARVYLTGLSMGGYGTFFFGSRYPERFAALAAVCGGVVPPRRQPDGSGTSGPDPYQEVAQRIGQIPVWMFHGDADNTVPVSESRKLYRALKAVGNPVQYTEYAGVGHNSWDRAFAEPGLFKWMLSQRKR